MIFFGWYNTILCVDFQSTLFITLLRDSSWEAGCGWEMWFPPVTARGWATKELCLHLALPGCCSGTSAWPLVHVNQPNLVNSEDERSRYKHFSPHFYRDRMGLLGWRRTLGSLENFWVFWQTPLGWMALGSMQLFGMAEVGMILTKSCGNPPSGVIHGEMSVFL